ncbi:uncharacterized protein I303_101503 [Kwoniella dejecticola CBS 10117]|uniref:Ribosome biogenesis protein UTP30 n=1 Tax=Kwoniella dejecticola CBS 10117 TaxID=1296121 RepID=A0A1A6ADM8_9TREE|nr:ribosome biogenesis protein UTP30 [Kwoniella dejecticola CBS 10117]OBR88144.1 ribosome biogenesis protein UTP30 [Kwoniella dejecticola CBS 10117]
MPAPIKLFSSIPSSSKPKKTPVEPLPPTFSEGQAKKAVDALLKHHEKTQAEKEEEELLPKEENVWLVVNTKRGSTRRGLMPVKIQLPHPPLPPPPATSICLLAKTPQREYKDLLAKHNIKFISRVVGVEKLKGKFKPFEPRRELMRDHEVFLCDERVLTLMPGLLGKMFFESKKQPIPVNMLRKDLKAELGRAISSTYFHPSTGTSYSIRIATPSSSNSSQVLQNLLAAIPSVISNIPDGWENVLSIGIKTSNSVMLPIWNSKLAGRFDKDQSTSKSKSNGDVEIATASAGAAESSNDDEEEVPKRKESLPQSKKKTSSSSSASVEPTKKKSSTIGSGSVAKKAKSDVVGTPKPKSKVVKKSKA